jgi:hypothetical protein
MLVQIALLAWIFLGESVNGVQILGLALVGLGVLVVQLRVKLGFFRVKTGRKNLPGDKETSETTINSVKTVRNAERLEGELD